MSWRGEMRKAGFGSFGAGNKMDYRGNFTADNIIGFPRNYLYVDGNNGTTGATGKSADNATAAIQEAVDIANLDSAYATRDTDIFVAGGFYEENVHFTKADAVTAGLGSDELLWVAGGTNVGGVSKIRLIATGYSFIQGPAGVAQPTLYFGRPNVEVHNFTTIKCGSTEIITAGNWVDADGGSSVHMKMPTVLFSDDYNMGHTNGGDTLDYGAANACLLNNCKVNGGTGAGGVLNNGGNWNHTTNCLIEYYNEYGIAHVGSSKGTAAENLTRNCGFHQQGASTTALVHGQAIIWWVDHCHFWDENPSNGLLIRQAQNGASSFCWLTDCFAHDEADFVDATNAGWDAVAIYSASGGGPVGNDDLTSGGWVADTADA